MSVVGSEFGQDQIAGGKTAERLMKQQSARKQPE